MEQIILDKKTLEFCANLARQYWFTCRDTKMGRIEKYAYFKIGNAILFYLEAPKGSNIKIV